MIISKHRHSEFGKLKAIDEAKKREPIIKDERIPEEETSSLFR